MGEAGRRDWPGCDHDAGAHLGPAIKLDCEGRRLVLHTVYRDRQPNEFTDIIFGGVVAHHFEHALPAKVILRIRVSKPGEIGKYTRFIVRRGQLPERLDTCLDPGGFKPMGCPSS